MSNPKDSPPDLDAVTYAIINANTEANRRIESFYPPEPDKQPIMSLANVITQRAKIEILLGKMRMRMALFEGPRGE